MGCGGLVVFLILMTIYWAIMIATGDVMTPDGVMFVILMSILMTINEG